MKKKISVCIATHNGEQFIHKQLISILRQLRPEDEVIISDDSSTDKTLDIIRQLGDKRIQIFENQLKRGPLKNFEQAICKSTGDLIFLSDQDDIWLADKVRETEILLQKNDLILSDCQVVDEKGELIHLSFFNHRRSKPGFWYNLYKNSYIGCCMAFRREVLEYVLPFPAGIHMHDWWIGLLVEAKGRVCFYPKALIYYVRHGKNASPTGEKGYSFSKRLKNRFSLLWHVIRRLVL